MILNDAGAVIKTILLSQKFAFSSVGNENYLSIAHVDLDCFIHGAPDMQKESILYINHKVFLKMCECTTRQALNDVQRMRFYICSVLHSYVSQQYSTSRFVSCFNGAKQQWLSQQLETQREPVVTQKPANDKTQLHACFGMYAHTF